MRNWNQRMLALGWRDARAGIAPRLNDYFYMRGYAARLVRGPEPRQFAAA